MKFNATHFSESNVIKRKKWNGCYTKSKLKDSYYDRVELFHFSFKRIFHSRKISL